MEELQSLEETHKTQQTPLDHKNCGDNQPTERPGNEGIPGIDPEQMQRYRTTIDILSPNYGSQIAKRIQKLRTWEQEDSWDSNRSFP